jgi:hypothetical protein
MPRAPPHSHVHDTPLPQLNYVRKTHRRLRRRGHPPPCRGPAAIGPHRRNSPRPCDPHLPPMLRHRFPVAKPDRRRRTAVELAVDRPRSSPFPPLRCRQRRQPPSLPGWWAHATAPSPAAAPSQLGQLGRKRARAEWAEIPSPGPVSWRIPSLFPFLFLFLIFTYIFRC